MEILVVNAGSSSLKYQVINMKDESVLAKGICERIGMKGGFISHKTPKGKITYEKSFESHTEALRNLADVLTSGDMAVLADMNEIQAVGHRVVQGGERYAKSALVTEDVLQGIEELSVLAPLHNPAHAQAIRASQDVFGKDVPQVVVFDNAFHQTMPEKAYMYALPYELYEKYGIRRYGFHGTSHYYVSRRLGKILNRSVEDMKIITCHLGNGSSICAIDGGKSVDTSMGMTPLEGLVMGTRCGSIDPSIVSFLAAREGMTPKESDDMMNKKSGYLGVSGLTSDQRDLAKAAKEGHVRARLVLDMQRYQVKKYIGAYAAAMGGVDHIIFTGGIGENAYDTRRDACEGLEFMGVKLNASLNKQTMGVEQDISADDATTRVWVIPTNEELIIARDTCKVLGLQYKQGGAERLL